MRQNKNRHMSAILMPLVLTVCFLFSFLCLSNSVSAVSLTISMSDSSAVSLDVLGTQEGSFSKSASRSFSVSTDNITGYTLSIRSNTASGNDGSGVLLYNGNDDTYVINSIGSENNFPTNGISENIYRNGDGNNNTYTNTWGYKPSMINSSNNSNFLPAPDATGDTLNITNCANGTENTTCINASDTYSITLGAKVDSTVRIGSYSNTFVILAVANAIPYSIIYNDNVVTSMPVDINSNSTGNSVTISSTVPVRDGYSFLGWCATTPTTTNGTDSCSGTVYNPNGNGTNLEYPLDRTGGSNNINLYAMWSGSGGGSGGTVPVTVNFAGTGVLNVTFTSVVDGVETKIAQDDSVIGLVSGATYNITMTPDYRVDGWSSVSGTLGSTSTLNTTYSTTASDTLTITGKTALPMQSMTLQDCQVNVGTNGNAANIGDTIAVYDERSSNYEAGDNGDYSARWINGVCWMTQNLRIQGTISAADSNFTGSSFNVSAYDLKTDGNTGGYCQLTTTNSKGYNYACSHAPDSEDLATIGGGITARAIGRWYNYYAATAGTISGSSNTTTATKDICPSGWHLPKGAPITTTSEFYKIFQDTSNSWISSNDYLDAFGAVVGGFYSNGEFSSGNVIIGFWWTDTNAPGVTGGTDRAGMRYRSSDGLYYGGYGTTRHHGVFIRCVKSS